MGIMSIRQKVQGMMIGVVAIVVVAGMVLGSIWFQKSSEAYNTMDYTYHGPAVRVDGVTLKDSDFEKFYLNASRQYNQWAQMGITISTEQIREKALQDGIDFLVIKNLIKKRHIKVPAADVNRFFNRLAKEYFPTPAEKTEYYARYGYKNDAAFKQAIREYFEEIYLYLDLAESKEKKDRINIKVTTAEIKEAYATVTPSHILLATDKDIDGFMPEATAKKKADEVYAKLQAGEDWDKLVKDYSTDPQTKEDKGNLGEMRITGFRAQIPYGDDFINEALALKVGEYTKPIKSPYGYHIIKMTARKEAAGPDFEAEKKPLKAELVRSKFMEDEGAYRQWLQARVAEAEVTILDPAMRAYQLKIAAEGAKDQSKADENWQQAAKFYDKAVRMRKHRWYREMFLSAIEVFLHEKMFDEAVDAARRGLKLMKTDLELQAGLGKALYLRAKGTDKKDGLAALKKAEGQAAEDIQGLQKVQQVYEELKLTKEVKRLEERIVQLTLAAQAEQEKFQKQMEEEQKKIEAEQSGADKDKK